MPKRNKSEDFNSFFSTLTFLSNLFMILMISGQIADFNAPDPEHEPTNDETFGDITNAFAWVAVGALSLVTLKILWHRCTDSTDEISSPLLEESKAEHKRNSKKTGMLTLWPEVLTELYRFLQRGYVQMILSAQAVTVVALYREGRADAYNNTNANWATILLTTISLVVSGLAIDIHRLRRVAKGNEFEISESQRPTQETFSIYSNLITGGIVVINTTVINVILNMMRLPDPPESDPARYQRYVTFSGTGLSILFAVANYIRVNYLGKDNLITNENAGFLMNYQALLGMVRQPISSFLSLVMSKDKISSPGVVASTTAISMALSAYLEYQRRQFKKAQKREGAPAAPVLVIDHETGGRSIPLAPSFNIQNGQGINTPPDFESQGDQFGVTIEDLPEGKHTPPSERSISRVIADTTAESDPSPPPTMQPLPLHPSTFFSKSPISRSISPPPPSPS